MIVDPMVAAAMIARRPSAQAAQPGRQRGAGEGERRDRHGPPVLGAGRSPGRSRRTLPMTTSAISPPTSAMAAHSRREKKRAPAPRLAGSRSPAGSSWNTSSAVGWMISSSQTMWIGR